MKRTRRARIKPSFSDLPRDILVDILLRLSVKNIFICKCVCKTWHDLVSDPQLAKLHFDQAEVHPLIQIISKSRMLYLVHPNKNHFELNLGKCDRHSKSGCVCNVQDDIRTPFRILERIECIKLRKNNWRCEYSISNSCNGFLCLFDPSNWCRVVVCNPLTGEFINLPKTKNKVYSYLNPIHYGFGFSPMTNQYKVIRMSERGIGLSNKVQVHILGTKTWKKHRGFFMRSSKSKLSVSYLNGFLYWSSDLELLHVCSFDIAKEKFGSMSTPTMDQSYVSRYASVGVLGGELCITRFFESGLVHIWAMKDRCTKNEWSKVFSFNISFYRSLFDGQFQPIKYLNDGAFFMFHSHSNYVLVYMDPKRNRIRCLKIRREHSNVKIIAHTPSFFSLKDALSGQNVKVHNARSAELEPHEDTTDIALVEQELHPDNSSDSYSSSDADDSDSSSESESDSDS